MNILDLDDISTWDKVYNEFIRNDPYWSIIESALSHKADDKIYRIIGELGYRSECVKSDELLALRQRCSEHFRKIYTHVAAYHACRPTNIESYWHKGIIPANTEELIKNAKMLFNNSNLVDEIVKDIKENSTVDYYAYGSERIWFWMSRTRSIVDSGYLEYGSELINCIASKLGEWANQKISKLGTPTLFHCRIPISWLEVSTADIYARHPLIQLIVSLRKPDQIDKTINGAFFINQSLPKEYILGAIDMTQFLTEE